MLHEETNHVVVLGRTAMETDRELTSQILAAHVECERQRALRIGLVHVVAVLSAPVGVEVAYPRLLSPAVGRTLLALWVGTALWTVITAVAEWRANRNQARRMESLRARAGTARLDG